MSEAARTQVFHDPANRRWRRFRRAAGLVGAPVLVMLVILSVTITVGPVLPVLRLSPLRPLPRAHRPLPRGNVLSRVNPSAAYPIRGRTAGASYGALQRAAGGGRPSALATPPRGSVEILGFFVNWDDNSFTSLKENLSSVDKLVPEWLHLTAADGTVAIDDSRRQTQVLAYIQAHRPNLPIVPLVNNFNARTNRWEDAALAKVLAQPQARARLIQNLLTFVTINRLAGICIDFEEIPRASIYVRTFMRELYGQFHPLGLEVAQTISLDDPELDPRLVMPFTDYLIVMAYDEHSSETGAGPVASQAWYAHALQRRLREVPPKKVVIALGSFGYDWGAQNTSGAELSFQEVLRTAQESDGRIVFNPRDLNPTFDYYDDNNQLHHVWFLDAVTAFNQMVEGQRYAPRGFALWRLGSEDPSVWRIFAQRPALTLDATANLRTLHYGYDLAYEGSGEVLRVVAVPRDGTRAITYDEHTGLISNESLIAYPSPYVIARWGSTPRKKIALTFDDGPDPRFTPAVLEILRRYHVPATFFIIGANAVFHQELVQQIVQEGSEIGNHTFTHPNIATISQDQLRLELNATERLIESTVGRRSLLFRPPYAEDIEPETPDQVKPLLFTSRLGYYTISMHIDPGDWLNPGADQIVNATIAQAVGGEGNIVLLHDGGGDRTETIAALPRIIDGLRARGFELVTVSNLLGLTTDSVMPPIPGHDRLVAGINDAGFRLINRFGSIVRTLFLLGLVLGISRLLLVGTLAVSQSWRRRLGSYPFEYAPTVSVLVAAFNEAKVIQKTLQALLRSSYPNFDIIVVDDGSSDGTYQRVVDVFGHEPRIRAYTQLSSGKAQALNYGVAQTNAAIIVALDADTIVQPDAIEKLVRHFADPRVGAVAGNTKVGNRINLLTRWQALEYVTSQNLDRRAFEILNCISVVPGAIGAWRRTLIVQIGGFANDTLAEDADLTLTILRLGYQVKYEEAAIGFTEAPDNMRAFLRQRFRWMYGTLQAVWKHLDTLFRPRFGSLGMLAIPNVLIFQIFFALISPLIDVLTMLSVAFVAWQRYHHPAVQSMDGLKRTLFFYALFLTVDLVGSLLAFLLERTEDWKLLRWLPIQRFVYRQLMYYVATRAAVTAIRGKIVGWHKVERKATIQSNPVLE